MLLSGGGSVSLDAVGITKTWPTLSVLLVKLLAFLSSSTVILVFG